jgi:hypothetical protein
LPAPRRKAGCRKVRNSTRRGYGMKGVVFTEFVEFAEERFGLGVADDMIARCTLPSGGAYTAIGTYDHRELVQMVGELSALSGKPIPELLRGFGTHLLKRFASSFPAFFAHASVFEFLHRVDDHIHVEVRKLYPDAELPTFSCEQPDPQRLVMTYQSHRAMADLAEGLIDGAIAHFHESVHVQRDDLSTDSPQRTRFTLTRQQLES